jgi:hypothetical protein
LPSTAGAKGEGEEALLGGGSSRIDLSPASILRALRHTTVEGREFSYNYYLIYSRHLASASSRRHRRRREPRSGPGEGGRLSTGRRSGEPSREGIFWVTCSVLHLYNLTIYLLKETIRQVSVISRYYII